MTSPLAALLALPLALATAGNAAYAAPPLGLLDRSRDHILRRADITSRGGKHGEVRLVERGPARVVQSLLYTKLLRRVLARIREREGANWPAGREGHEASARYLAALEEAERSIPRPVAGGQGWAAERRRPLLIEFAVSSSAQTVALLEPRVEETDGVLSITGARLIEALELPRNFVQRDMRLIAEEHFALAPDELARLLAPPGPTAGEGQHPEGKRDSEP